MTAATQPAAVTPGTPYTVVNSASGKCADARAAATANGTAVQQYACNATTAQQWTFTATSGGYFQVSNGNNAAQVWDVTNVSTADSAPIQLWTYSNGNNQQWQPVAESDGSYHFVNRNSGKCLDVPAASTADSVQLQQYSCNGSAAQSFTLNPAGGSGSTPPPGNPTTRIWGRMSRSSTRRCQAPRSRANSTRSTASSRRTSSAPSGTRWLFRPGSYNVSVNVGYYTQVLGLGLSPNDTTINGAGINVDAQWDGGNATQNFWRGTGRCRARAAGGRHSLPMSLAAMSALVAMSIAVTRVRRNASGSRNRRAP